MSSLIQRASDSVKRFFKANSELEFENKWLKEQRELLPSNFLIKGSIGTPIQSGYYDTEEVSALKGSEWYPIADKMIRTDPNIRKNVNGVISPILAASYQVEAASEDPLDLKIKEFIDYVIFEQYRNSSTQSSFYQFILEAAWGLIVDGNAPFEPVYKGIGNDPTWGNFTGIEDIAYRDPRTFTKYQLCYDGSIEYIEQQDSGDLAKNKGTVQLPGWALMIFVNDKIGADWEGLSMLRSAYGAWQIKQAYLRTTQKMGQRSLGVPVITLPDDRNNSKEQLEKAKDLIRDFTSLGGQMNGITLPNGYTIDSFEIAGDKVNNVNVLQYLDGEEDKAFGAAFASKDVIIGGSRAAREDASKDFYRSIEAIPKRILDVFNFVVVRKLVNAKFGKQLKYPKITVSGIVGRDMLTEARLLQTLSSAGLIRVDERMLDWTHKRFELPDYVTSAEQKIIDNTPDQAPLAVQNASKIDEKGLRWRTLQFSKEGISFDTPLTKEQGESLIAHGVQCQCGDSLHAHERIEAAAKYPAYGLINDYSEEFQKTLTTLQEERTKVFLDKIEKTLTSEGVAVGGRKVVKDYVSGKLGLPANNMLKATLSEMLAELGDKAKAQAYKDVGAQMPKQKAAKKPKTTPSGYASTLDTAQLEALANQVGLLSSSLDEAVLQTVFYTIQNRSAATDSVAQLMADVKQALQDSLTQKLVAASVNAVSSTVNSIRNDVFLSPDISELIEVYRFTNPSPESAICKSLAGRIFSKEEYASSPYLPPLHWNCKSIVTPITIKENKGKLKPNPNGLTPSAIDGYSQEQVLKSAQWVG